jgi:hypothetical protein
MEKWEKEMDVVVAEAKAAGKEAESAMQSAKLYLSPEHYEDLKKLVGAVQAI